MADVSRRVILRLVGASAAAAGAEACSRGPQEYIVPYVNQPPEVTPSVATVYATTMTVGGYGVGILATSHEGRPTKLEGNPEHPASLGALGAIEQASLWGLYDPKRAQGVRHGENPATWSAIADLLARPAQGGKKTFVLLEPTSSPHLVDLVRRVRARGDVFVGFHSPLERRNVWEGARLAFGKVLEPRWDFSRADVVLSLDADFLAAAGSPQAWARAWASRRRIEAPNGTMSRLYVVEPRVSVTGMQRRRATRRAVAPGGERGGGRAVSDQPAGGAAQGERMAALGPRGGARPLGSRGDEPRGGGRRSAAGGARDGARAQRGPRERGTHRDVRAVTHLRSGRRLPRDRGAGGGDGRGRHRAPRHRRWQPGVHGPIGRGPREAHPRASRERVPRLARERDGTRVLVLRARGALPRELGRRPRVRRDGVDRAADSAPPRGRR